MAIQFFITSVTFIILFFIAQRKISNNGNQNNEQNVDGNANQSNGVEFDEQQFKDFQKLYNRKYVNIAEYQKRFDIFKQNKKEIENLNKRGDAVYELNQFFDLSTNEFLENHTCLKMSSESVEILSNHSTSNFNIENPQTIMRRHYDWREYGKVSKVKNQGQCRSCWAFSAVGNIESLNAIKTGKLEALSEQQLLDCDKRNFACGGGLPIQAFLAIREIGGLHLESDYQYQARKQKCHFNKNLPLVKVWDAISLPKDEVKMQQWLVDNGPISIGINIEPWKFYKEGVVHMDEETCSHRLNHAMLIVGYDETTYSLPYWIIKNSWGKNWGENGYARLYRGENVCGVREAATSAVL